MEALPPSRTFVNFYRLHGVKSQKIVKSLDSQLWYTCVCVLLLPVFLILLDLIHMRSSDNNFSVHIFSSRCCPFAHCSTAPLNSSEGLHYSHNIIAKFNLCANMLSIDDIQMELHIHPLIRPVIQGKARNVMYASWIWFYFPVWSTSYTFLEEQICVTFIWDKLKLK